MQGSVVERVIQPVSSMQLRAKVQLKHPCELQVRH